MPLTSEQASAIAAFTRTRATVITAGAGTGKTSTLVELARTCPDSRVLYMAFNRAIAVDAGGRFGGNTRVSTTHSLAYRDLGHRFKQRLNGARVAHRHVAARLGLQQPLRLGSSFLQTDVLASLAMRTVDTYCASSDLNVGPGHVPAVAGLTAEHRQGLIDVIVPAATRAWRDVSNPDGGHLRTTHDVYLKLWALTDPELGCDVILFDEAQDATPVITQVVAAQQARGARVVVVGDAAQAIYRWRGSVCAMDSLPQSARVQLTRSFRFGPQIATLANRWLRRIGQPLRLTGSDQIDSRLGAVPAPDAVLCRTNGGVMQEVLACQPTARPVAVVGGVDALTRLAQAAADLKAGKSTTHPELVGFATWGDVQDYVDAGGDGNDLRALTRLVDKYGPPVILQALSRTVPEGFDGALVVSTAHKAKGREWESVKIASDFTVPAADAPREEVIDEGMLAYVAGTRARRNLDPGPLALPPTPRPLQLRDPWAA